MQAGGAELLVDKQERQTDGIVRIDFVGHRWRHDQLRHVDTQIPGSAQHVCGTAAAVDLATGIVGIHAAVAIDGDPGADLLIDDGVVAELRDPEIAVPTFHVRVQAEHAAGARHAAVGHEDVQAGIDAIAREGGDRRVVGAGKRVVGLRQGHAAHALGFHAITDREIPVGGVGGPGGEQQRAQRGEGEEFPVCFHGGLRGWCG